MVTTEEILQHAGVKGMKWGVRKRERKAADAKVKADLKSGKISKSEARTRKRENYHKSKSNLGIYKTNYALNRLQGGSRAKSQQLAKINSRTQKAQLGILTAYTGYRLAKPHLSKAYSKATSPEAIRAGKNIVQALKRTGVRYVDGSQMKNVINP